MPSGETVQGFKSRSTHHAGSIDAVPERIAVVNRSQPNCILPRQFLLQHLDMFLSRRDEILSRVADHVGDMLPQQGLLSPESIGHTDVVRVLQSQPFRPAVTELYQTSSQQPRTSF